MMEEKSSIFNLTLDAESTSIIKTSVSWARILSISGYILAGVLMMLGIVTKIVFSSYDRPGYGYNDRTVSDSLSMGGTFALVVYIIVSVVLAASSTFLLRFANKATAALKTNSISALNGALANVRAHLSIWAVVMIIVLLMMVLGILSVIL